MRVCSAARSLFSGQRTGKLEPLSFGFHVQNVNDTVKFRSTD